MPLENDDLEKARQAMFRNKPDLVINCVPKDTLEGFKKLADEHFKDNKTGFAHYGFTLQAIFDAYNSIPKTTELEARIAILEEEVSNLKNAPKPQKTAIKLGDGKTILVGRKG